MSKPSGDVTLRMENLTKNFRGFTAVKNLTLEVSRGTIHALIGPNGAGKTTVFNLATKFLQPSGGRIYFNGQDITTTAPDAIELSYGRRRVLEIATTLALDPELLLLDEPMSGLGQEDIGRIAELIKKVAASRTVLMVEHNLSVVADLSHRITVLARGEILADGTYAELVKNPAVIEAYLGSDHG